MSETVQTKPLDEQLTKSVDQLRWYWSDSQSLIRAIVITGVIAILLAGFEFYSSSQKSDAASSVIWQGNFSSQWTAKNDLLILKMQLSQLRFQVTPTQQVYVPLEPSFIQQAADMYKLMIDAGAPDFSVSSLRHESFPTVNTIAAYKDLIGTSSAPLDKETGRVESMMQRSDAWQAVEGWVFVILMTVQVVNLIFAARLSYIEHTSSRRDSETTTTK